jgi:hypothetical protein
MCRQRRKQGKLKVKWHTQAKRRCACSTSTWAAAAASGDRVKDKHNTVSSHSRYFEQEVVVLAAL